VYVCSCLQLIFLLITLKNKIILKAPAVFTMGSQLIFS
jgi:hypothetical protein